MATRARVLCPGCGFEGAFDSLSAAREWIDDHERETGHDPSWEITGIATGVERAGSAAGVCGIPESKDGLDAE